MMMPSLRQFGFAAILCSTVLLGACLTPNDMWQEDAANRIAVPANLHKRQIPAGPYSITIFERAYKHGEPATIYIEGDGLNVLTNSSISNDPTPDYPMALHLASRDLGDNVVYVARPCQFSNQPAVKDKGPCTRDAFTTKRFSLEAMEAMNDVLDTLKARNGFTGFHLVGYDGGATVATLLTARRKDVLSLRTVAGVLDTSRIKTKPAKGQDPAHAELSGLGSLNPVDFAAGIAHIPQHHFFGAWDKAVTPDMYTPFRAAMGPGTCARMSVVEEVDHTGGWVNRWPSLLKQPVDCKGP